MLVLIAGLAALSPSLAGAAGTGSISGKVTNSSGDPVQYSCVKAYDSGGSQVAIDSSDFFGDYKIEGLVSGDYRVEFMPCDNITLLGEFYDNQQTLAAATTVPVTNGSNTPGVDAQLALGGSISGKVTNSSGDPVGLSCVKAYDSGGNLAASDNSDNNGDYSIVGLASGDYRIEFRSCGRDVSPEFYDDQETLATATVVAVTAGSDTSGVNAQLAPGGSISGTVTDSNGAPLEKICVNGYGPAGDRLSSDRSDVDGNYTLAGFATGDYRVEFGQCASKYNVIDEFYSDKDTLAEATPVPVTAGSITPDIDVQMAKGGSISGTLVGGGSGGSGNAYCFSKVQAYDSNGDTAGSSVYPDSSGAYTINRLKTGDYRVQFVRYCADVSTEPVIGLPPVMEYYRNKGTLEEATPVSVTAGLERPDIDAVLGGPDGTISGTVTNDSGSPLNDICVTVYGAGGGSAGSAQTDASGNYKVFGLAAGDFRVRFAGCGDSRNLLPEFYDDKATLAEATPVPVAADSDTTGIDARLATGGSISGIVSGGATGGQLFLGGPCVTAYDSSGNQAGFARADSIGQYTINKLKTGDYRLEISDCAIRLDPSLNSGYCVGAAVLHCVLPGLPSEFYFDKPSLATATPVAVTEGEATTEINYRLGVSGAISGTVTDSSGAPLDGICVEAYDQDGNPAGVAGRTASGNYQVNALRTGSYRLKFSDCLHPDDPLATTEYYNDKPTLAEAEEVSVIKGSITPDIDAQLVTKPGPTVDRAEITKVSVKGPAKVKKGRRVTFGVKVTNSGSAEAKGVRLEVQGRGVGFNTSVAAIPAGATRTVKVRLKPKKSGRAKVMFKVTSSNAGGMSVKRQITVR